MSLNSEQSFPQLKQIGQLVNKTLVIVRLMFKLCPDLFVLQGTMVEENDEKAFYESDSEDKKEQTPTKAYVMDPDHRLLLRNTKPLLQSRNTAVSEPDRQKYLPSRVAEKKDKHGECRSLSPRSLKVSVAVQQREEKCPQMKVLIKMWHAVPFTRDNTVTSSIFIQA